MTPAATALDREPPLLISAFFGLDDALPARSRALCRKGPGRDGMPVTFSRRVVSVDPSDFVVVTRSGVRKTPECATLRPADGALERHTVLLIGDVGGAQDPPVRVEVVGDVVLEAGGQGRGLAANVTPLEAGPALVLAIAYEAGTVESDCPSGTRQVLQVTWAGGIRPKDGATQEDHRTMYRVVTGESEVTPFALSDIDDNDNYVHLCLGTPAHASEVRAQAGVLVDPRGDVNPSTFVRVNR
ncbi:MAG: hypothetical protein ACKVS7_02360 [Gemmatimonadaceae bacterium]